MILDKIPLKGVFLAEKPLPMLAASFVIGIGVSLCIDILSNERTFGSKPVFRFFTDFFSVIAAYFMEFLCALNFNNGIIRWYHAASLFLAVFLYKKLLSEYVVLVLNITISAITKMLEFIIKYIALILKFITLPVLSVYAKTNHAIYRKHAENKFKKYRKAYFALASRGFYLV